MTPSPRPPDTARQRFLDALDRRDVRAACSAARALASEQPGTRAWSFLRHQIDQAANGLEDLRPVKIALLSTFSTEFVHNPLVALAFADGMHATIYQAGFGQFRQDILDSSSGLYRFDPDVVILALEGRDVIPEAYHTAGVSDERLEAAAAEIGSELTDLIQTLRSCSTAAILVHNFAQPIWLPSGILDPLLPVSRTQVVANLNHVLASACRGVVGAYVVDYAGLVFRQGALDWYDHRMRLYARAPIAARMLPHLVSEYLKFLRALTGRSKKCVVVDLDNTLWGGVLGEVGVDGIQLGPDYPGSAYVEFQEALLALRARGVLLAVASKNNPQDVDEVLEKHPHMRVRREHFASVKVGWMPKSASLREIAAELNIGLDHIVFVDDNPVECEEVTSALAVTAICLPREVEQYVPALLANGYFDAIDAPTREDARRGELYQQRDRAEELRVGTRSIEEFYKALAMEVQFAPVTDASLPRAAQLTQKTNQFNVTTIRRSVAQMAECTRRDDWVVQTVLLRDRFGDNGMIGVLMAQVRPDCLEIDTMLLSCRVIGRGVESAMLAWICDEAVARGLYKVRGRFVPTAKNGPARDVFERHGFEQTSDVQGETVWLLNLAQGRVEWPEWFRVAQTCTT